MKPLVFLLSLCYYFGGVSFAAISPHVSAMGGWSYHGKGIKAVIKINQGAVDVGKPPYPAEFVDDDVIRGLHVAFYSGYYFWVHRFQFRCLFQGRSKKLVIVDLDCDFRRPKEMRSDFRLLNEKLVSQLQALGWSGTQLIQLKWGEFRIANTGCGIVYDPSSGSNPSQ